MVPDREGLNFPSSYSCGSHPCSILRQEWDAAVTALVRCAWADPLSSLPQPLTVSATARFAFWFRCRVPPTHSCEQWFVNFRIAWYEGKWACGGCSCKLGAQCSNSMLTAYMICFLASCATRSGPRDKKNWTRLRLQDLLQTPRPFFRIGQIEILRQRFESAAGP